MAAAATLADLQSPGADEASLNSWKESLGLNSGGTPSDDHRKVIVKALICRVEGRPDIRLDLTQANLKSQNLTIALKEDTEYNLVVQFRIQHKVVSGLTYAHMIKRLGTTVEKRQELLASLFKVRYLRNYTLTHYIGCVWL